MPAFSENSKKRLATCHPELQRLFNEVVIYYDCTVLIGHRGEQAQNLAFTEGMSLQQWPNSKHNSQPSLAADVVPFPVDWNDRRRFYHFAGFVMGVAKGLGISLRWGGDWDGDIDFKDQRLDDLPHFELVDVGVAPKVSPT